MVFDRQRLFAYRMLRLHFFSAAAAVAVHWAVFVPWMFLGFCIHMWIILLRWLSFEHWSNARMGGDGFFSLLFWFFLFILPIQFLFVPFHCILMLLIFKYTYAGAATFFTSYLWHTIYTDKRSALWPPTLYLVCFFACWYFGEVRCMCMSFSIIHKCKYWMWLFPSNGINPEEQRPKKGIFQNKNP